MSVRIVFAAVMLGSLWLLFAGHNQPGGGFVGGIVAGAAVSLRYVSGGLPEVRRLSRGKPWMVLGAGLLISVVVAIVPLLLGGEVLQTGSHTFDLPLLGSMKVTSALFFDIGVYLAVIGLAMMVFESFGDEPSPPGDVEPAAADATPRSASSERADGVRGRRPVRHRHVPRAAAQAVAADHRPRPHQPRRQRRVRHDDAARRGRRSSAPAIPPDFADPLPQALVLTAIVISFGVTALLLALAYRSWLLTRDDEVQDDVDDRNVGQDSDDTEVVRRRRRRAGDAARGGRSAVSTR